MPSPLIRQARQKPRTCVACREEAPKRALVRIARTPSGEAVLDITGKLPGRGAYICLNPDCMKKARKSGAIERALKTSLSDSCWEELELCVGRYAEGRGPDELLQEIRSLLGLARRSGGVIVGMDNITENVRPREGLLLLTAQDCSETVTKFAEGIAPLSQDAPPKARGVRHEHRPLPLGIEALSGALGLANVQIIALRARGGLADKLKALIDGLH